MYFLRGDAQDRFFKLGLAKTLIQLIVLCDAEYCEEMLQGLLDFLMTRDQKINQLHADYLKQNGIGEALKRLNSKHDSNSEVRDKVKFVEEVLL